MRKLLFLSILLAVCSALFAEDGSSRTTTFPGGKCFLYRVTLKDKAGSGYSLQNPEEFLSLRAIERRQRQRLPLDSTDLPVSAKYVEAVGVKGVSEIGRASCRERV